LLRAGFQNATRAEALLGDPALINTRLADLAAVTSDEVLRVLAHRPASSQLHYLPKGAS